MSFNEMSAQAIADGDIGVGFLIDEQGNQFWSVGTWEGFDPLVVLQEWKKPGMSSLTLGTLRFTVIGKSDDKFVSTNIGGQGHLIGAKCMRYPGAYLICWCPSADGRQPDYAYTVVKKLADLVSA